MIQPSQMFRAIGVVALVIILGACAETYKTRELSYKIVGLDRSPTNIEDSNLLGVRIEVFDPGKLPEDENMAKGQSMEIRKAESYYLAVQLKNTMQGSGHWGPVRVVPKGSREGEVIVNGRILESDGESHKLEISVKDATGTQWFTKEYESVVDKKLHLISQSKNIDVYQYLYNVIANDIALYKRKLTEKNISTIRKVSELRFGADFAPNVFNKYIKNSSTKDKPGNNKNDSQNFFSFLRGSKKESEQNPQYTVLRLPSEQDPFVQRVNKIRIREDLLIDLLDEQYSGLARNISDAYIQWRISRLNEINAIREIDRLNNEKKGQAIAIGILGALVGAAVASNRNCYSCAATGGAIAGVAISYAVQKATQASRQAEADLRLRQTALEELGQSLVTEVKPVVIEVEGKTVELRGSIEEKFEKWRGILKELREKEMGPISKTSMPNSS